MSRFEVLAVNDKKSHCECCGRQGLKKVVWIYDHETHEEKHFGTSCALQPAKGFGLVKEIRAAIRKHEDSISALWMRAHKLYRAAGGTYSAVGNGSWTADNRGLLEAKFQEVKGE